MKDSATDPMRTRWTCLIPAAGRGSRLAFSGPKLLLPIAGRPILHHLVQRFQPYCARFVIVASPAGEATIASAVRVFGPSVHFEIVVQPVPIGMADAIRRAECAVQSEFTALVWGDQVCLCDETVGTVVRDVVSHDNRALSFPTALRRSPYTHIVRRKDGSVDRILQAREGEMVPTWLGESGEGENDCGFFAFRSRPIFKHLHENADACAGLGAITGEQNFLQLIPALHSANTMVTALCIATEEETLGVNTRADAEKAEVILKTRLQNEGEGSRCRRLRLAMFSGGRGTASLAKAFVADPRIELNLLVNAYDDGLSTGRLRSFLPNLLGPSDVRKNVARLIPNDSASNRALAYVIEFRLPSPLVAGDAVPLLRRLWQERAPVLPPLFWNELEQIAIDKSRYLQRCLGRFLDHYEMAERTGRPGAFDFADCPLGNLVLAGAFLEQGRNFNRAIEIFQREMKPAARVFNVSRGEAYVLTALCRGGAVLASEAEIAGMRDAIQIEDLFLLEHYLTDDEKRDLDGLPIADRRARLHARSLTPRLSPEVDSILRTADVILYGPGTQHSSLFPSYLTEGLSEAIVANRTAEKIFIGNILKDSDIQAETANSLIEKFFQYSTRRGTVAVRPEELVTRYFLQAFKNVTDDRNGFASAANYLRFSAEAFHFPSRQCLVADWEAGFGEHSGGRVLDAIMSTVSLK